MVADLNDLDGPAVKELEEMIVEALGEVAVLERLVFHTFTKRLAELVNAAQALPRVAFDLIMALRTKRRLPELIRAVVCQAPAHPRCVAFCGKHAPYLLEQVPAEQAAAQAKGVLQEVADAGQTWTADVRAALQAIRAPLERTRHSIDLLKKCKAVHKQLHAIDFHLLGVLDKAAVDLGKNPAGIDEADTLSRHNEELAGEVAILRNLIAELPEGDAGMLESGVKRLETAVKKLRELLEAYAAPTGTLANPEKPINELIRPVLRTLPPYFHARLNGQCEQLAIAEIIDGVSAANQSAKRIGVPSVNGRADSGLGALLQLRGRLQDLVTEHAFWQRVDVDLRICEKTPATPAEEVEWMQDLREQTPELLDDIGGLCKLRAAAPWAIEVGQSVDQFDKDLRTGDFRKTRRTFATLFTRVRNRFKAADDELYRLCENLSTMDGPLARLGSL